MCRVSDRAREYQRTIIGRDYEGATLSNCTWPNEIQSKIVEWVKNPKHALILAGSAGVGKTHFCSAMIQWAIDILKQTFRFYRENEFFSKIRSFFDGHSGADYMHNIQYLIDDFLIIYDDLGVEKPSETKPWRQEIIFKIIDDRYSSCLPTIYTTNLKIREIKDLYGERTYSRLTAKRNTIIDLHNETNLRNFLKDEHGNLILQ